MKLYSLSDGPPSLSVRMALKALNLPFDLIPVNYLKGEFMTEDYAKMNPQKEIPVLDDDGFFLSESNAILQYLCDKYAPESPLYPKDPKARALVNHRLCYNLSFVYPAVLNHAILPIFYAVERNPMTLKKVQSVLLTFEEYLKRENSKYAAGNSLTIADFPLFNSIMSLEAINFSIKDYPKISSWYENFKKAHPNIWHISESGMKELAASEKNPPDLSPLNHPFFEARKMK